MKKGFALAVGIIFVLVSSAAFGLQPMSEAEMDSIMAQSSMTLEDDGSNSYLSADDDGSSEPTEPLFTIQSEASIITGRSHSGVAIFIDDVKIFISGSSEIWYQGTETSQGQH